jgi:chemotaxis protein MotB
MKRSSTPLAPCQARPENRSIFKLPGRPSGRAIVTGLLAVVVMSGAMGCVTRGTHSGMVSERDRLVAESAALEAKLERYKASNASLHEELNALLEEFEDERISRGQLEGRVAALSLTEERLSTELTSTTTELEQSKSELAETTAEVERLSATYGTLVSDLESEVASGQIQIEQLREGLRVRVDDDVLFASGSAKLDPIGRKVLEKVAVHLVELDHQIVVQGHTDDRPITGSLSKRYATNWDLAAARASRVVRLLEAQGVKGERLTVASYAEFRPIAPNDSAENRSLNRRIELRLKPFEDSEDSVPASLAPPSESSASRGANDKATPAQGG